MALNAQQLIFWKTEHENAMKKLEEEIEQKNAEYYQHMGARAEINRILRVGSQAAQNPPTDPNAESDQ
jgi:hypothetical protein